MSDLRARAAGKTDEALRNPSAETIGAAVDAAVAASTVTADLDESPIPAEMDVPVHVAWSRVMGDVLWLGKGRDGKAGSERIKYRGIDDIRNTVGPVLRRHGVVVIPSGVRAEFSYVETTKSGQNGSYTTRMNYARVTVTWTVMGPQGDILPLGESLGEAFDPGDKASTKAQSIAERVFYIAALCLPTDRPEMDTEHGAQHQLSAPRPPTAEEYYDEIMRAGTSHQRIGAIWRAVNADPDLRAARVKEMDGSTVVLIDAVVREGERRKAP